MQGAFDFNPLDVLAAAAALQSANENVPPRELVYDGENDESVEEPDEDPGSPSVVKKVCEDFQNSESGVNIAGTSESNSGTAEDVSVKKRGSKKLYSDIYHWNNMHGKDVLRILKEKNHLANISHYLDHPYASCTPHHDLIQKIKDLTKSEERGSDSEDNDKTDASPDQVPVCLPNDNCLRMLLTSEKPADLSEVVRGDATVEQSIVDLDVNPPDSVGPAVITDEPVMLLDIDVNEHDNSDKKNEEIDCIDNGTGAECPTEICAPAVQDAAGLQTEVADLTPGDSQGLPDSKETALNESSSEPVHLDEPVVKETDDAGVMLVSIADSVDNDCSEASAEHGVESQNESCEADPVLDDSQLPEPTTAGTVLQNGYIHLIEPTTFIPTSQSNSVQQTLLLVGPDGIYNSVLMENSQSDTSGINVLQENTSNSESKTLGQMASLAPKVPDVTKLLFETHPTSGAGDASQKLNTSSLKSVCDKNNSWSKLEVSHSDGLINSPLKGQEKFVSVTDTINGIVRGSDQGEGDGVLHLTISGSSLAPQKQQPVQTLLQKGSSRSVPMGRQLCSSLVPSPSKDKLTLPSDSTMKHLRIAGGMVVPCSPNFWDNSSDADSSMDPSNTDSQNAMTPGLTTTSPSSGLLPSFVPLTSPSQTSPLPSLNIGFSKQNIDIGQVSPIGSEKSRSNLNSPNMASPLTSPRDPSFGGKRNAFMTNKDICIGLHCSSPSESCLMHHGLCIDRPSSVSSQDNSIDGLTDCGSPAPIGSIGYQIKHSIVPRGDMRRNRTQLIDSESNSECDCPSGNSSRNQSPDSKKGHGVHRQRISAEHDYLSIFGKPRPPDGSGKPINVPPDRNNCQPHTLPLNSELANQLLKLKPSRPSSKNPVGRPKAQHPKTPKLGMLMKRGLYIPTGPLVSDADKRGEHPLKDHDYCLHAFYQAMTFNTVDEGPRRPGPVPKVKVKKEKKKPKVEISVSDSNDAESPEKRKNKKKYKKLKTEVKKKKKKVIVDSPTSAETSDGEEVELELEKPVNIKKEPLDFSDEGEKEPVLEKDDPLYVPPVGKLADKVLRSKDKKVVPFSTRQKDEDRVKVPGTARFQDQFIYFATKKPRRRARPVIGDISKLPQKMFTSQSEFLPGLDSSYIEARSKYLGKLVPEKTVSESETVSSKSEPFPSMDLPQEHLDLPSDFMMMNDIPHGKLAVGISEEESQFIQSLYNEDHAQAGHEEYPQEIDSMACDLTNEQVREFLNHFGVEKAMKFLTGENVVEETVETASPVPLGGDDTCEHMISDKDPHMLPVVVTEPVGMNTDIAVSSMSSVTSAAEQALNTTQNTIASIHESLEMETDSTAAEQALNTTQETIASIRESLEMETESIKSGTSETHLVPVSVSQDSTTHTESVASEPPELDVGTSLQDRNDEVQDVTKLDQKEVLNTHDLGFTNIATDSTPHDLFDLDDDDLLNANLNFVNMNMILNFQSPEKMSMNQRANDNNRNLTKMRKINFEDNSNVPSSSQLLSSPLIPKPIDTASIDSDISIDSITQSSHPIESTRPGRNNPFSIGKPDMFKSGMLNRLHNIPDPTDSGVPELIFVNMFWNDLPGLLINEKEYVRLVDIHKQVLPAKPTGLLKNRCRALKLEFTNCSELQRDFLIRYAHAAASRSTLIVTKAVAETLIGYYVNPPPRSTRADLHEENETEDVEIEQPKFTGGKGKGKGKRSRLNGDKASSRLAKSVNVDEDSAVANDDVPLKLTLKLKDCPNYSRLLMPKDRLVSYSTSDDSSTDDESTESEPEDVRKKRVRKIVSLRRKAKSLRNDILLLTGQVIDDEELPSRKRIYRKRLPIKLTKRADRNMSGIRSGHSSASSSRRSSVDYSRRKMSAKMQKLLLNPEEAEERTKQAIFDIDSTIDEVLGNVRRQCEAEERRGKVVRNVTRPSNVVQRRALPALYQHLLSKEAPAAQIKKSISAPSLVTPVLGSAITSCEKDIAPVKMGTTGDDGVEIPITLSNKVSLQPIKNTGPRSVILVRPSSVTNPQSNETSDVPRKETVAPSNETLVSNSKVKPVLIEIPPEVIENISVNESEPREALVMKRDSDLVEQPSEKHVVTIENFSPTSGRSKFIQPILIEISESNDGVVSIDMPTTPAPNDHDNKKPEENVDVRNDKTTESPKVVVEHLHPQDNILSLALNGRDLTTNVQNELDSPSKSSDHLGPLRVLHRDSANSNGKRLSQSGGLYVNMFNDKSSKCIMCTNCGNLFTIENFLCHLHGADTVSLLDVRAKQTLDIQSSEPSEWEQTQWQEFKAKCCKFEAETPSDVEKNGKNGNKIVKALQFEIINQAQGDKVVSDPNVRHSGRVRKPKQRFSIEEYMFSSGNPPEGESEAKTVVEIEPKKINREIRKVSSDSSNNKNLVDNGRKSCTDNNKNQVHEVRNIEPTCKIKRRNRGLENGNNSDMRLSRNHVAKTVQSKKENTNNSLTKVTPPSVKETPTSGLRVSSRESTSRFKRLATSSISPPTGNKKPRLDTETRHRSRSRSSTSPAASTQRHLGDKP
ncbi:uncharacterized protein LOC135489583 [Lineus longissimus]|uniref:uncharacterized protein LOC135489583 n=1 Tax=Lineus longissimus TaxID=88925 RepID=UPI002B4EEB16